ncbi:MAG: type II toxin-antitoxin system VapC family toxin [Acidimicrobiales bacterium]|nr:type II toxin-antitoxin system VapC family toxin [Acidimicrobiales bacterium]
MKLIDVNVLIYAIDLGSPKHTVAKSWLDHALSGSETVALPSAVTVGFVRITTNPRIVASPLAPRQAIDLVREWHGRPNVTVPQPTARHLDLLTELLEATGVGGNLVTDAHLAALAIEHGADLVSYDTDFSRFPGLVWQSPAAA